MTWTKAMASLNRSMIATFSQSVVIHLGDKRKFTSGIFDEPSQVVDAASGFIENTAPTLHLRDEDAAGVKVRTLIEINKTTYIVAQPVERDGFGMTTLTLSKRDESSASPSIRY